MRVLEKVTENSERLGQQPRRGIELGTSCLRVLSAEPLRHCWDLMDLYLIIKEIFFRKKSGNSFYFICRKAVYI